ncbi:MAG: cbb3-type cytochrome c oxidase N-terminal domain-containing protein [Bacteroidota bacterium]|nr:cbb3-type cytochrome c oxidase N-terminal domain-containing protein [Bacteroidota bacterium]
MKLIQVISKIFAPMFTLLFSSTIMHAQEISKNNITNENIFNVFLSSTAMLLGIAIVVIVGVLITITMVTNSKKELIHRNAQIKTILLIIGFGLLSQNTFAQDAAVEVAETQSSSGVFTTFIQYWFMGLIVLFMIVILLLFVTLKNLSKIYKQKAPEVQKIGSLPKWWHNLDKKIFTKAIPVEHEADFLLDHDYDGIKELDNALPPWWKYGFYITIVVAFVYMYNYHGGGDGKNPLEEYETEIEKAKADQEIFESKNKDKIDETNVPMADVSGLEKGKEIFTTACFACHGKLGEGGAGPNLTDDYWIHKGSLNDIYLSIKNGFPDKGMQAWSIKYNPKEMSYLASYIKTLKGTKPANGKAPQGDLYTEGENTASTTDSTKNNSTVKLK